jgi:hypothetical protein
MLNDELWHRGFLGYSAQTLPKLCFGLEICAERVPGTTA